MQLVEKAETLEQYVHRRKSQYKEHCERHHKIVDINIWRDLVSQWKFDFEMDQMYGKVEEF
jgi:hypothetical protein